MKVGSNGKCQSFTNMCLSDKRQWIFTGSDCSYELNTMISFVIYCASLPGYRCTGFKSVQLKSSFFM